MSGNTLSDIDLEPFRSPQEERGAQAEPRHAERRRTALARASLPLPAAPDAGR